MGGGGEGSRRGEAGVSLNGTKFSSGLQITTLEVRHISLLK